MCSIGLAVDYTAHIVHCWLRASSFERKGITFSKTMVAIDDIGVSVLHGAISTLLMVLITAFADNYIFEVFFKLFLGIIILGIVHGLFLLPVILK